MFTEGMLSKSEESLLHVFENIKVFCSKVFAEKNARFFYKQRFFSTQLQCCLTF